MDAVIWMVGRATARGAWVGLLLGAGVGTLLFPVIVTVIGAVVGLCVGGVVGAVNGVVFVPLVAAGAPTRIIRGVAAAVSLVCAIVVTQWAHAWLWCAVLLPVLAAAAGAVVAPEVARPSGGEEAGRHGDRHPLAVARRRDVAAGLAFAGAAVVVLFVAVRTLLSQGRAVALDDVVVKGIVGCLFGVATAVVVLCLRTAPCGRGPGARAQR